MCSLDMPTVSGPSHANGEGEKVFGQIMMLKNANSKEVICDVKARVEEVQKAVVCAVAPCSRRDGSGGVERVWDYVARTIALAVGFQLTLLHEADSPFGGYVLVLGFLHLVGSLLQMPLFFGMSHPWPAVWLPLCGEWRTRCLGDGAV